jgi:hypothetical protein
MIKALLSTAAAMTALATGLYPVLTHAYALDPQLDCKSDAHTFIASLADEHYIESNPIHVETNSVNAFRPTHGSGLTAFGFRVNAVLGYAHDDTMFRKGSGEAIAGSLYGAIVSGSAETVGARVRQAGGDAVVHEVLPLLLTAIVCNEH